MCPFWGIKYLLAVNDVLVSLHVCCVGSASVRAGGSRGAFRVPRKPRARKGIKNQSDRSHPGLYRPMNSAITNLQHSLFGYKLRCK